MGIEVDGPIHIDSKQYDIKRDRVLRRRGIEVIRFSNNEVLYNPNETVTKIYQLIENKHKRAQACFIATAAFGTPMAQEINTLREFRDTKMVPNQIGHNLVLLYYKTSPPLARIISKSKKMRVLVRLNLKLIIQ